MRETIRRAALFARTRTRTRTRL